MFVFCSLVLLVSILILITKVIKVCADLQTSFDTYFQELIFVKNRVEDLIKDYSDSKIKLFSAYDSFNSFLSSYDYDMNYLKNFKDSK